MWESLRKQFRNVGALIMEENGLLKWSCNDLAGGAPSSYVVTMTPGLKTVETILYVGKAGRGWRTRAKQHNGGLKRVHEGKVTKAGWVLQYRARSTWLSEGRQIIVWERAADSIGVFGEADYAHDAEERVLIKLLKPIENTL